MTLSVPKRLVEVSLINFAAENARNFITHCEIEYENRVLNAAKAVLESGCKVVMCAGPSASGKTTSAHKLAAAIKAQGTNACVISLDNFFKNIEDYPRLEDGTKDYENVTAIDIAYVQHCIKELASTGKAQIPDFDFLKEMRKQELIDIDLMGGIAIFEGIHALNPVLSDSIVRQNIFKIYVGLCEEYSYKGQRIISTRDIRLARRMVRDYNFRGHSPAKTVEMWQGVLEGENIYVRAYKPAADYNIDTSFSYEICCLAPFIKQFIDGADESTRRVLEETAAKFVKCDFIPEVLIPPTSMLREFIGE